MGGATSIIVKVVKGVLKGLLVYLLYAVLISFIINSLTTGVLSIPTAIDLRFLPVVFVMIVLGTLAEISPVFMKPVINMILDLVPVFMIFKLLNEASSPVEGISVSLIPLASLVLGFLLIFSAISSYTSIFNSTEE